MEASTAQRLGRLTQQLSNGGSQQAPLATCLPCGGEAASATGGYYNGTLPPPTDHWSRTLPKVELHQHMDSSAGYRTLQAAIPSLTPEDFERRFVCPADLVSTAGGGRQCKQSPP